jgi:hypothetical protein
MLRLLILLMGMLTTRTGKVDTAPLRARDRHGGQEPTVREGVADADDPWQYAPAPARRGADEWEADGPVLTVRRRRPRRHGIPRWAKWAAGLAVVAFIFRKAAGFAVITALSAALHLVGLNIHLPHVSLAWPWTSITAGTTTDTDVGPWVLQKIEGISRPALGTENFNFVFTHKVNKSIGFWPCWYASTFYAVGRASATVDLNPGPAWWAPASGHYRLQVISRPVTGRAGQVAVTIVLPPPQLPQSVHDISVDDTLSRPIDTQHSWTYPGFGCGAAIKPQFSVSVLYGQAQNLAFYQATHNPQVTQPLITAAENEAGELIRDNFIQPTVNALGYTLTSFSLRWAGLGVGGEPAAAGGSGGSGGSLVSRGGAGRAVAAISRALST